MRWLGVLIVLAAGPAAAGDPIAVPFAADPGKPPAGWTPGKTGAGEGSVWRVTADPSGPGKTGFVLTQTAAGPNTLYNLCLLDGSTFRDGEVAVAVKPLDGKLDRGGGLVWRAKDVDNYYLCRFNPLENNLRLYHVVGGKRTQLGAREDLTVPAGDWFTVSVRHTGDRIECSLNGRKRIEQTDETFPNPGRVGVWSKADAVSSFDHFRFTPAEKSGTRPAKSGQ